MLLAVCYETASLSGLVPDLWIAPHKFISITYIGFCTALWAWKPRGYPEKSKTATHLLKVIHLTFGIFNSWRCLKTKVQRLFGVWKTTPVFINLLFIGSTISKLLAERPSSNWFRKWLRKLLTKGHRVVKKYNLNTRTS